MEPESNINTIHEAMSAVEPVSLRTVMRRATQEKWVFREVKNTAAGGKIRLYLSAMLPADVQLALKATSVPVEKKNTLPTLEAKKELDINRAQEDKAYAKAELAKAYAACIDQAPHGQKGKARKSFFEAYNLGNVGTFPAVFAHVGRVDLRGVTVGKYVAKLKKNGWDPMCLVDRRGYALRGKRTITPEMKKIVLGIVLSPYNVAGKPMLEIIRQSKMVMESRGIIPLSDVTYRRWLTKDWIPYHYDQWIWWREGDKGLNDKVLYDLSRDYNRLESGDMLVADGHILNFEVMNPLTGKPKRMMLVLFCDFKSSYPLGWEVSPSEDTAAISIALRRAIIRLGKIPKAIYIDNGRAFKGKYFMNKEDAFRLKGLYQRMGIKHVLIAWAYHGQSKPIERFFETFGELERWAPSYVGTSIDTKPVHMNRGEKLRRKLHEKITGGVVPTIEEAHRAIGQWFDLFVDRPKGPGSQFPGQTPNELMIPGPGVDPVALRCLMMKTTKRLIRQKGVNIDSQWYYNPKLYGRKHYVYCRHDFIYSDSVLVYDDTTNEFICEAFKIKKVHPMVSAMGTEADKAEYKRQIAMKNGSRKMTVAKAKEIVETQVLPESRQRIEAAGFTLDGDVINITKAKKTLPSPVKLTSFSESERKEIMEQMEQLECCHDEEELVTCPWEDEAYETEPEDASVSIFAQIKELPESDRFEKLVELEVKGWMIPREHQAFMKYFEQSTEYLRNQEYFEEHRVKMALMYDMSDTGT